VVSNGVIAISAPLTSRSCLTALHLYIPEFIEPENWPENSQSLNAVDFVAWDALQQKLYR